MRPCRRLFRRIRDHAGMADWPCTVEVESDAPREVAAAAAGIRVFTYRRGGLEPVSLIAGFASNLARYLIETFDEAAPGGDAGREPAGELAAVFMGFGVFMANSAARQGHHRLSEGELAHALALFCLLRELPPESVDPHLNPHLRKYVGSPRATWRSTKCSSRSCAPPCRSPRPRRRASAETRQLIKLPWP